MTKITQETVIPLGLAVVVIGGVASWVSEVNSHIKNGQEIRQKLQKESEASFKLISEINARLSRIEWKLEERKK